MRRRHHKAEGLSPEAMQILHAGLERGATYDHIVERIAQKTGETIAASSVGRYHQAKFRPRQQARVQAQEVAERLVELGGLTDGQLARALKLRTAETLYPMMEELAAAKPEQAAKFFAELDKNRIEEARLGARLQELELLAQRLEHEKQVAEQKLQAAQKLAAAPVGAARRATREELEQRLRDLYGIVGRPAVAEAAAP